MKKFVARVFDLSGKLTHSHYISARSHPEALAEAHSHLGSPDYLRDHNMDLWVVPA